MLIRNVFIFFTAILFAGCAGSYAPREWLSEVEDTQQESFGGWLTVISDTAKTRENKKGIIYAGEFIGYDSLNVYLLSDSLIITPKKNIPECILQLDNDDLETFTGWALLGALSSVTHGYYFPISTTAWFMTASIVNSGESHRDRHDAEYPDESYWQSILIYSRFPQGIPPGLDLTRLKPKPVN